MKTADAAKLLREHIESNLFPKTCANCGFEFQTLREYLLTTKHIGQPQSFEAENGTPLEQKGTTYAMANCKCGSTLTLTSKGMSPILYVRLMSWGATECIKRQISFSDILEQVRDEIDRQVLESEAGRKKD